MNRKEQKGRFEQAAPSLPPTLDGLNNVSDLISKFEVRNYPINRGLLPELSSPRPTPPGYAGIVPGAAEWYRGAYHYSPTHSPPLGQTRRRSANGGVPSQYDSAYLSDTASLSDGADSVSPGGRRMDDRARFRARQGGVYYQNGSLSSLNESDYYEDIGFDVGPRTPPSGRFYAPQQRRGEGAVLLEEVEEVPLNKEQVTSTLTRFGAILQMLSRIPFPRMSVTGMGLCSLVAIFFCPRAIGSNILFPGFRLLFGTLYPAYASYKAVRTKNVKEYVKWMMYWIVFAFFTFIETFTDILLSWFPFYYEIKVIVVLWLLSPATRGSSTLYRKFVHPMLTRREQEIDDYINQAKEKGYTAVLQLGSKGVNYATNVIMQTAIKGGGGLVQTLRKSYSLSDLSEPDTQRTQDEVDEIVNRPQRVLRSKSSRSSSGSRQMEMYFPEVEIAAAPYHATAAPPYNYIRSSDDISSGYSSAEPGLSRTASMSNTARPRLKSKTREDDEEYSADVFYDEQDQHMLYGRGGPLNDRFFPQQRATIYELAPGGSSSLPAITQAGHTVEHGAPPIYSSSNTQPSGVPAEMNDKYKLFLAWMEEQQRRENGVDPESSKQTLPSQEVATEDKPQLEVVELVDQSAKDDEIASVKQEKLNNGYEMREEIVANAEPLPAGDDDFQDTISISSNENDEFLEVEAAEPNAEALEQDYSATDTVTTIKTEMPMDEIERDNSVPEETPEVVAKTEGTENESNLECDVDAELQTALTAEVQPAVVEIPAVVEEKEPNPTISVEESTFDTISHPEETSNLLAAASSNSNLTSSSSSLAISEGSTGSVINLAVEGSAPSVPPKKHPSFGKQRKAPPVPPPAPEMIVVREKPSKPSTVTTTTTAPTVAVQAASKASVDKTKVTAKPTATAVSRSTSSPAGSAAPEKSKPKKFMSSLTGMFKGHGEQTATTTAQQSAATAGHPKETEI
nr:uncharacterized protein LOC120954634 isoform X1 [Anopheles coluzzii]XP_040230662.2 uncharacterized protein LOC120954634 isoform X1 [Anopheles coluzzii]